MTKVVKFPRHRIVRLVLHDKKTQFVTDMRPDLNLSAVTQESLVSQGQKIPSPTMREVLILRGLFILLYWQHLKQTALAWVQSVKLITTPAKLNEPNRTSTGSYMPRGPGVTRRATNSRADIK